VIQECKPMRFTSGARVSATGPVAFSAGNEHGHPASATIDDAGQALKNRMQR